MAEEFGNAFSMSKLAGLSADSLRDRFGDAFLVIQGQATPAPSRGDDDATHDTVETMGVGAGALSAPVRGLVWVVVKKPASTFAWVSVGRHENNDIYMPHQSVSRFHALIREDHGVHLLHDAKSANGTAIDGLAVPTHGRGAGAVMKAGAVVRFGEIITVFLDGLGIRELSARTPSGGPMTGVGR